MGYAGNTDPSFIVPTAVATADEAGSSSSSGKMSGVSDLDFYVGDEVSLCLKRVSPYG